jgi:hypothetical protein
MPDFIMASPPCNKFSLATAVKGGNIYFEKDEEHGVIIRNDFEPLKNSVYKNSDPRKLRRDARRAIGILRNTKMIIDYYKPKAWYIENPTRAYTKFFMPNCHLSKTEYCMYGFDYKKPTTFFSNIELDLKRCNHKTHTAKIGSRTTTKDYGETQRKNINYNEKSSIPKELILEIYKQFKEK